MDSEIIRGFRNHLREEEKSDATIEKYIRDVTAFASYLDDAELTKETVIEYKQHLLDCGYAVRSINSMLASLNSFFSYANMTELKVKALKLQQEVFCPEEKELSKAEYKRLCIAAKKKHNQRLYLTLQTICSTWIRVSELKYITAEAVKKGKTTVSLKGKTRTVIILKQLQKMLLKYMSANSISEGAVFVTRTGNPVSRTNIWKEMKSLCDEADVDSQKVFPHNLRHLFARVFYSLEKDIAKLADILGHSSINTTRIYIMTSCVEYRQRMEQMHLII